MKSKARSLRFSQSTSRSDEISEKLEMYRAFMTGYVKRINEATFNVPIGGIKIGTAKYTRLAQINLKSRIITFSCYAIENVPERGRRYLVLHELAHVKEANHNKRFWQLVGKYEPDYRKISKNLESAFKKNIKEEERSGLVQVRRPALSLLPKEAEGSSIIKPSGYNMPGSAIAAYEDDVTELFAQYKEEENDSYDCEMENLFDWTVE